MRRRSALFALVLILTMTIGPGRILADDSRPTVTTIGQDGLILYRFAFAVDDEVPWDEDGDNEPDPYEAAMTVYVISGTFAFYGEGVTIQLPPDSDCLEIQTGVKEGEEVYYQPSDPGLEETCEPDCPDWCQPLPLDDPLQALILKAGTVIYLPAETPCFICAIAAATGADSATLDVTVRGPMEEDPERSWASVAIPAGEATPEASSESNPAAFHLGKLPMRNPGGCAGRF